MTTRRMSMGDSAPPVGSMVIGQPGQTMMERVTAPIVGRDATLFQEVNLDTIEERLAAAEVGNADVFLPANNIVFTEDSCIALPTDTAGIVEKYTLNEWAMKQLASLIDINQGVLKKSPAGSGKASKKAIVDHWLAKKGATTVLIRFKRNPNGVTDEATGAIGYVRAIMLTDSIPFSHRNLITAMRPWIRQFNMGIQIGNLTARTFNMRTLFREEINLGEGPEHGAGRTRDLHALGVHWRSSEVGFGPLQADLIVYRQVCKNGMIAMTEKTGLMRRQHKFIDPAVISTEIGMAMQESRNRQDEILGRLRLLRDAKVDEPKEKLSAFLRSNEAGEEVIKKALEAFEKEPLRTRYGLLQAMTRAAQNWHFETGRLTLETLAGKFLAETF